MKDNIGSDTQVSTSGVSGSADSDSRMDGLRGDDGSADTLAIPDSLISTDSTADIIAGSQRFTDRYAERAADFYTPTDRDGNTVQPFTYTTESVSVPSLNASFDADAFSKRERALHDLAADLFYHRKQYLDAHARACGYRDYESYERACASADSILANILSQRIAGTDTESDVFDATYVTKYILSKSESDISTDCLACAYEHTCGRQHIFPDPCSERDTE